MSDSEVVVLTKEDNGLIKAFLVVLYGDQANSWPINNRMAGVVKIILEERQKCKKRFDLVPGPVGVTKVGLAYIRTQLLQIAKRKVGRNLFEIDKDRVICRKAVAGAFRTMVDEVRMGT
ncbi:MAG: hypothetical protein COC05_03890 [Gammaproteobacteria bacterium]|nr:MAG: hypothetical protein COC05_03890 [Gammaproteobacteria bacterium]